MKESAKKMNIDDKNKNYWGELSGSRAVYKIKITKDDPDGAEKFDNWFFWYYPYLNTDQFINWSELHDQKVLEIGLGYGSVGRRVAASGAQYIGIDISLGPVSFLRETLDGMNSQNANVGQASAIELPFADNSFDQVISIGCLHHTGNMRSAFSECHRVLKPNGELLVMVYYAFSYKRWLTAPRSTWQRFRRKSAFDFQQETKVNERRWYDRQLDGTAAPQTEFASHRDLETLLEGFEIIDTSIVNLDNLQDLLPPKLQRRFIDQFRRVLLGLVPLKHIGLDIYVRAKKIK